MDDCSFSHPNFLNQIAWAQRWRDRAQSVRAARAVLEHASEDTQKDRRARGLALRTLCWQTKWSGKLGEAEDLGKESYRLLSETKGHAAMADVDSILGVVHYSQGRMDLANEEVERGFSHLQLEPSDATFIDLLTTKSTILRHLGRLDDSRTVLGEALEMSRGTERARVQHNIARFHLYVGALEEALVMALGSVAASRRWRNMVVLPYALEVLGTVHRLSGRSNRARQCLCEGIAVARADGDIRAECQILQQLGSLALATGETREAIGVLEHGRSLARSMNYMLWEKNFCKDLASAYEADGDLERALEAMKSLNGLRDRQIA